MLDEYVGIVDCDNFFVSCERVFDPSLCNRPVVVLSNNDGCVVARSNEVKKMGIKMGIPAFQIQSLIRENQIKALSCNHKLYANMSDRVMNILSSIVPKTQIYSVDEAFFFLNRDDDIASRSREIIDTIMRSTGIPVSIGIASTKTLAKMASRFAKIYPRYNKICIIDSEEKRIKALEKTEIDAVWGIGRRSINKLKQEGISTAYDFARRKCEWSRRIMGLNGERTWSELNGIVAIENHLRGDQKTSIMNSRTLKKETTRYEEIVSIISKFTVDCAISLRKQKSCARSIEVFLLSNRFREDSPFYNKSKRVDLPTPSNSMFELITYAKRALDEIFTPGIKYKKIGVIVSRLTDEKSIMRDLFDDVDREKHDRIMSTFEKLRKKGMNIALASETDDSIGKREHLSADYISKLEDIIIVHAR